MANPLRINRTYAGASAFGVAHAAIFTDEPMRAVFTQAQGATFAANTNELVADIAARDLAKNAYEAAVSKAQGSLSAFLKQGNTLMRVLDAYANEQLTVAARRAVYEMAEVPAPSAGSPTPPPARPTAASATLDATGTVSVTWAGSLAGVTFVLQRQLTDAQGQSGGWTKLSYLGGRPFTDDAVPVGTRQAQYQVQAWRGRRSSPWSETATLRFTASAAAAQPDLKIAA